MEIGSLSITVDGSSALTAADQVSRALGKLPAAASRVSSLMQTGFDKVKGAFSSVVSSIFSIQGALAGIGIGLGFRELLNAAVEEDATLRRLQATLVSTGNQLGTTAGALEDYALALERTTGIEHDATMEAQNVLLKYQKVLGNQDWGRLMQDTADLAVGGQKSMGEAAHLLAMALQEPEQGMRMLVQAGIRLSEAQRTQIKNFMDLGQVAQAQNIILGDIEGKYKGAAAAGAEGLSGSIKLLKSSLKTTMEEFALGIFNAGDFEALTRRLAGAFSDPSIRAGAKNLGNEVREIFYQIGPDILNVVNVIGGGILTLSHFVVSASNTLITDFKVAWLEAKAFALNITSELKQAAGTIFADKNPLKIAGRVANVAAAGAIDDVGIIQDMFGFNGSYMHKLAGAQMNWGSPVKKPENVNPASEALRKESERLVTESDNFQELLAIEFGKTEKTFAEHVESVRGLFKKYETAQSTGLPTIPTTQPKIEIHPPQDTFRLWEIEMDKLTTQRDEMTAVKLSEDWGQFPIQEATIFEKELKAINEEIGKRGQAIANEYNPNALFQMDTGTIREALKAEQESLRLLTPKSVEEYKGYLDRIESLTNETKRRLEQKAITPKALVGMDFGTVKGTVEQDRKDLLNKDWLANALPEEIAAKKAEMEQMSADLVRRFEADSVSMRDSIVSGWDDAVKAFGTTSQRMATIGAGVADTLDRGFTDAFTGIITGTKSVGDAFKALGDMIIQEITRMIVQQMLVRNMMTVISSVFKLGGSMAGAAGGFSGGGFSGGGGTGAYTGGGGYEGSFHAGGIVPTVNFPRYEAMGVSPMVEMPSFHAGGTVPEIEFDRLRAGGIAPNVTFPRFHAGGIVPDVEFPRFHAGGIVPDVEFPRFHAGGIVPDVEFPRFHAGGIIGLAPAHHVSQAPAFGPGRGVDMSQSPGASWGVIRRMHGGGVGDEVPIMARKGEGVFTPEQMKAMGGQRATQVNITNVIDPRLIDEAVAARLPGQVLNVIGRNKRTIKAILQ